MSTTVEIHPLRLSMIVTHARLKSEHGMGLTNKAPSLADTRIEYRLDDYAAQTGRPSPRSWKAAYPLLKEIKEMIDAQIETARIERAAAQSAQVN